MSKSKTKNSPAKKKNESRARSPKSASRSRSPQSSPEQSTYEVRTPRMGGADVTLHVPITGQFCPRTGQPYTYYCETREELITDEEASRSPSFRILPINEAYRIRLAMFYNTLNTHLFQKKEQLVGNVKRMEFKIEQIRQHKNAIERDIKGEFSAMNERLNGAFGNKTAILQHQIHDMTTDLDRINNVITQVESSQDVATFLKQSRQIKDQIELCVSKPVAPFIEQPVELPCELGALRQQLESTPAVDQLLEVKNAIIWSLLNGQGRGDNTLDATVQEELTNWARLTDRFASQVSRFQMICANCGVILDPETVNTNCNQNLNGENAGRHFFKSMYDKISKDKIKTMKKKFKKADKDKNGEISIEKFEKILKKSGFNSEEVGRLRLKAPVEMSKVIYKSFLKVIK